MTIRELSQATGYNENRLSDYFKKHMKDFSGHYNYIRKGALEEYALDDEGIRLMMKYIRMRNEMETKAWEQTFKSLQELLATKTYKYC